MKRFMISILLIVSIIFLTSCKETTDNDEEEGTYEVVDQSDMNIYIKQNRTNLGDIMPFYDNGIWQVFYLQDDAPRPGFHPFYRFSTTNFFSYEDKGEQVPVVHNLEDPELALGTGSVFEKEGIYYVYYTKHNGKLYPKEQIGIAISTDGMNTWIKQPEYSINPLDYGFDGNDFRDPHVVYVPEKELYYMLITTRYAGKGAIAYMVSRDLVNWEKQANGIFFVNNTQTGTSSIDANLECPSLFYSNGYWYLSFSDQWPIRVTHYVYKSDFDSDWVKPLSNTFDGKGLYAGKIATDGNRMMLMGWVSHNFNRQNEFGWGGNLIVVELKQFSNGQLYVDLVRELAEQFSHPQKLEIKNTNLSDAKVNEIKFNKTGFFQYAVFDTLEGINKITGKLNISDIKGDFGILFDYFENEASFFYSFSTSQNQMHYYKGSPNLNNTKLLTANKFYKNSNQLAFTLLFEEAKDSSGSIVTLYIEGQMALTGRMYLKKAVNFGFYAKNSAVTVTDLKLYK